MSKLMYIKVLKTKDELETSRRIVSDFCLPSHHDSQKDWDTLLAFSDILRIGKPNPRILDSGSGAKAVILQWLYKALPMAELHACDRVEHSKKFFKTINTTFRCCDISATSYEDGYFDIVTSISVIEHGVDIEKFIHESYRILKSGGSLLISTDYWFESIDTKNKYPYGKENGPMKIFDVNSIAELVFLAREAGFETTNFDPMELATSEKCITWSRMNENYTFIYLKLNKP